LDLDLDFDFDLDLVEDEVEDQDEVEDHDQVHDSRGRSWHDARFRVIWNR
jgi:hypothetical protein